MQTKKNKNGTLYVVATPIGNLQDITGRAIEVLKNVARVVTEDTRHTAGLLNHFAIKKPSISLHEFNEKSRLSSLLELLESGQDLALVSDAGTPLISDPGFEFVREAKRKNINVVPIPGACALIAALSASGIRCDKFIFEGFLPAKSNARVAHLNELKHETRTMIFYEAPHRLLGSLEDCMQVFGAEREAAVARELTKIHESILLDNLEKLHAHFEKNVEQQRGEVVMIIAGTQEKTETTNVEAIAVLKLLLENLSLKQAVELAHKITKERKNMLYEAALEWQKNK